MPYKKDPARRPQARYAALTRSRAADDPELVQARQQMQRERQTARINDYIDRIVAETPPLSAEQRARLVMLLQGGADDAA